MRRILTKKHMESILIGATYLGAGGGGSLRFAGKKFTDLEKNGVLLDVELWSLDELAPTDYGATVASLGSPLAMIQGGEFGADLVHAYQSFKRAFAAEGKTVSCLYSGEMGGLNTFVPMLVSIMSDTDPKKRIPLLDVDSNGRAVPELNTTLASMRGYPPFPIGLGNMDGDEIICYPKSSESGEKIARTLCEAYNMQIGFCTWGMNRAELESHTCIGYLSYAESIGDVILAAKRTGEDPRPMLRDMMMLTDLFSGEITDIEVSVVGGFDVGTTTVRADSGELYWLDFQNENMIARDETGKVLVTIPELIVMLDQETGMPLTNADTSIGMKVHVSATPAHPLWWQEDKQAYLCFKPALERLGYTGMQVRL